ncbi:MAG: class II aldolase/adducin family protein [Polyangiaceae bacterium]|nr:class II aldolase/adducin family protein [Polyangiaceae bacterium]
MDEGRLREALASTMRHLYERGHNAPGDGNASARLGAGFLCTPTATHKGRLPASGIVRLRADGSPVDPGARASSELKMHLAIYAARPDVGAIVHAHSPHATALTLAGLSLERPTLPEAVAALGAVPTLPYASPTTADVALAVVPVVASGARGFLLERHGPVCLGADVDEALTRLEVLEHTARITWLAHVAGGAAPLPDDEVARLRRLFA